MAVDTGQRTVHRLRESIWHDGHRRAVRSLYVGIVVTREAIIVGRRLRLLRPGWSAAEKRTDHDDDESDRDHDARLYYFLRVAMYATSASTSSFGSAYGFIAGFRSALVLVIIAGASTIQA